jgi:hypothetical protein
MSIESFSSDARTVLREVGWPILDAPAHVPAVPGLYAIHASADAWAELGLEFRPGVPL